MEIARGEGMEMQRGTHKDPYRKQYFSAWNGDRDWPTALEGSANARIAQPWEPSAGIRFATDLYAEFAILI